MQNAKIHFVVGNINIIGGVEKVTLSLADEFCKKGFSVQIHSLYSKARALKNTTKHNIINYELKTPNDEPNIFKKIIVVLRNGFIFRKLTTHSTGTWIFQGFYVTIYLLFFTKNRSKIIVCEHNSYKAPGKLSRLVRHLLYCFYQPILTVLCEADKKYFKHLGVKNIHKIYNPNPYHDTYYSDRHENKNLISLGRFTSQKRFDLMITLCAPLLKSFPDWNLKIQGAGEDFEKILSTIDRLGLQSQVKLIPLGDPTYLYNEGSIFLMTSQFEGLPMTLIESMNFGIPSVVINCSDGLSEIIINGENGFLVPMDSEQAFVDKLRDLMENSYLRSEMGKMAKIHAQKFHITPILKQWEEIIS